MHHHIKTVLKNIGMYLVFEAILIKQQIKLTININIKKYMAYVIAETSNIK